MVERKGGEWNGNELKLTSTWWKKKTSKILKQNQVPRTPVQEHCFLSPKLNHLHLVHHGYSSGHAIGYSVAAYKYLQLPNLLPLRGPKRLQLASLTSGSCKNSFIIAWDPGKETSLVFPFLFRLCFHLQRLDHIQKVSALLCVTGLSFPDGKCLLGNTA